MNAKPMLASSPGSILTFAAASLAAIIALCILWAVVFLFQSRGAPMERLATAERACAHHAYPSERHACMQERLVQSRVIPVAVESQVIPVDNQ